MGEIIHLLIDQPTPADRYREELGARLVFCATDDSDYDQCGVHILFLDYLRLLQDEWARVNYTSLIEDLEYEMAIEHYCNGLSDRYNELSKELEGLLHGQG